MKLLDQVQPKDIIALVVIVTCLILMAKGVNSLFSGITIMIVTYYFRKRTEEVK